MAVGGVLAKADVGREQEVWEQAGEEAESEDHRGHIRVRVSSHIILGAEIVRTTSWC